MKIRRGDTVRILSGKDRGKRAAVMAVVPRQQRILVEGINMVKKHVRPKRAGERGQRVTVASPLHISNVQLVCTTCKKGTRVRMRREGEQAMRVCVACGATI